MKGPQLRGETPISRELYRQLSVRQLPRRPLSPRDWNCSRSLYEVDCADEPERRRNEEPAGCGGGDVKLALPGGGIPLQDPWLEDRGGRRLEPGGGGVGTGVLGARGNDELEVGAEDDDDDDDGGGCDGRFGAGEFGHTMPLPRSLLPVPTSVPPPPLPPPFWSDATACSLSAKVTAKAPHTNTNRCQHAWYLA